MTLPIHAAHLPDVVAQLQQVGVCYYNIGSDLPDGLVDRTKQIMFEHGIPQGSDDPVAQWMGAPPLGPITDPPGRVPPSAWADLAGAGCETCDLFPELSAALIEAAPGCPDCVRGQRRHTLTADCDTCDGLGTIDVEPCQDYPDGIDGDEDCDDCDDCDRTGRVSVDVVVPQLRQLVTRDTELTGPFETYAPLHDSGYASTLDVESRRIRMSKVVGDDPAPGDFVAIIRKVET